MTTIEIGDEPKHRIDDHLEDDETYEESPTESLDVYETEGSFLREGYSED